MNVSDTNVEFPSGAKRGETTGRPRPDLIPGCAMLRIGVQYAKGAEHYGARNFEKGIPSSRALEGLERHLQTFKENGCSDEDELSAIVFNCVLLIMNEERVKSGKLPACLLDLPFYKEDADACKICEGEQVCPNAVEANRWVRRTRSVFSGEK